MMYFNVDDQILHPYEKYENLLFYISAFQLLDRRGEGKILRSKYLQWKKKTMHTFWT
jgi:hypothetical protein